MQSEKITVSSTIQAPVEKVWEYYTRAEHITKWNFASDDWHCPHAENDLRKGGVYKARMEAKDGSFGFDFEAVYDEIIEKKKIAYTMGDGRTCITEMEPSGNATRVTTTFDAETINPIEMQKNGWQMILDNFKNYVER